MTVVREPARHSFGMRETIVFLPQITWKDDDAESRTWSMGMKVQPWSLLMCVELFPFAKSDMLVDQSVFLNTSFVPNTMSTAEERLSLFGRTLIGCRGSNQFR